MHAQISRPPVRLAASLALAVAVWLAAFPAGAQTPGDLPHIGYLWMGAEGSDRTTSLPGFQQGLRELGYQDGVNVDIEYRYAAGSMERRANWSPI